MPVHVHGVAWAGPQPAERWWLPGIRQAPPLRSLCFLRGKSQKTSRLLELLVSIYLFTIFFFYKSPTSDHCAQDWKGVGGWTWQGCWRASPWRPHHFNPEPLSTQQAATGDSDSLSCRQAPLAWGAGPAGDAATHTHRTLPEVQELGTACRAPWSAHVGGCLSRGRANQPAGERGHRPWKQRPGDRALPWDVRGNPGESSELFGVPLSV